MINFDSEICTDYQAASSREWLETNGIGGFACGTLAGVNTRRYHALLTPATAPPLGRITTLSKFEETLTIDGESYELSANCYQNGVYPQGYQYLKNFRLAPFPVWTYEINGIEIEKKLFMVDGENTTVCTWKVQSSKFNVQSLKIELSLKPLLAFCDYHHLQHEDTNFDVNYEVLMRTVSVKPYASMPAIFFNHNAQSVEKTDYWYRGFQYAIEKERGFDSSEDLFQPFALNFDLTTEAATVIVSTEMRNYTDAAKFEKSEIARREKLIEIAGAKDDFTKQLVLAADQFIVKRGAGKTVIAGYPWFSDWGRDTMIALNGLTLATNRPEIAKQILLEFSQHVSEGMIPNRFPDIGETAEYNTVDATLWYFEAIRAYAEKTGDYEFVRRNLYDKLVGIILSHLKGTRYNIHVDTDGLLFAGGAETQLTWMDAKDGDTVFTPRTGKPVEIQALWYNALKIMADFANRFDDAKDSRKYDAMAELTKQNFNAVFWNEAEQCLFDVVNNGTRDGAVRPNQIFAVSLPHTMLSVGQAQKIVRKVEAELLTTVGLRSLAPDDANYCPIYTGSPFKRDSCYHQGTVWAWLVGGFVDAYRRVNPNGNQTETRVAEILSGYENHLREAGIGQISEIFDADAPFNPRGCFAQAWSVAEVLRVKTKTN